MRCLYVLAALIAVVYGENTICEDMMIRDLTQSADGYSVDTHSNDYIPGSTHNITVSHAEKDFTFTIQASTLSSGRTVGRWIVTSVSAQMSQDCDDSNPAPGEDTLTVTSPGRTHHVLWVAPSGDKLDAAVSVDFFVMIEDSEGKHRKHSIVLDPREEPVTRRTTTTPTIIVDGDEPRVHETQTEDQLKMDALKKKHDEIDLENQASEADWNKAELEEERRREEEMHREEMEFEANTRKELEEKQERIRAEIRDKEEFDHLMREKERVDELEKQVEEDLEDDLKDIHSENEIAIDDAMETAGSSRILGGLTCLVVLVVRALF